MKTIGAKFTWVVALVSMLLLSATESDNFAQLGVTVTLDTWEIPTANSLPSGIEIDPITGNIFFAEFGGNKIGFLDPRANTITEWTVGAGPNQLAWDLSSLYFTVSTSNQIAKLIPLLDAYSMETIPTSDSFPKGIALNDSLNPQAVWFTERLGNRVGRLNLGGFTFDALQPAFPTQLIILPNSSVLSATNTLVPPKITPGNPGLVPAAVFVPESAQASFSEWDLSGIYSEGSFPETLAVSSTGQVWIANSVQDTLLHLDPINNTFLLFDLPAGSVAVDLAIDPSGNVWFTEGFSHRIGKLDPLSKTVTEWATPTAGQPLSLAFGENGLVWFTEREGDRIGVLDPVTNTITEYQLEPNTHPLDLLIDDNGAIWFTAERGNFIGRLRLSALGSPPVAPPDAITGIQIQQTNQKIAQTTIDYSYSGSHGVPAFLEALPTQGGVVVQDFSYLPGTMPGIGTGSATARIEYQGSSCINTDGIEIWMFDNGGKIFFTQSFAVSLMWGCN